MKKENGKTGQGDLLIKGANIGGDTNLIIDVALIHEFGGNHMADVSLNGALRHAQPDKLLEAAARTKMHRYREAYATRPLCLLPAVRHQHLWAHPWRVLTLPLHPRPPTHPPLVRAARAP